MAGGTVPAALPAAAARAGWARQAGVVQAGLDPVGSRGRFQAHGGRQPDPVHRTGLVESYTLSVIPVKITLVSTVNLKIYPALRILRSILHPRHHLDCSANRWVQRLFFSGKSPRLPLHMAQRRLPGIRGNP